jgi:hypothetical protein
LLVSHQTLKDVSRNKVVRTFLATSFNTKGQGIESKAFFPVITNNSGADDNELKKAYAEVYTRIDENNAKTLKGPEKTQDAKNNWVSKYKKPEQSGDPEASADSNTDPFKQLITAQSKWNDTSLSRNTTTVREEISKTEEFAKSWLEKKIKVLEDEIEVLSNQLRDGEQNNTLMPLPVVDEKGVVITDADRIADPGKHILQIY